jgi:hypothetical protein
MVNPNFQILVDAAKLLKPILGELVFVGGCTTAELWSSRLRLYQRLRREIADVQ